jgi:hypothetical protein
MLPSLRSWNVTKPVGAPPWLVTLAVKVTQASRATVFLVTVRVVVVRLLTCGDADAFGNVETQGNVLTRGDLPPGDVAARLVATGITSPETATMVVPARIRPIQPTVAHPNIENAQERSLSTSNSASHTVARRAGSSGGYLR